MTERSPIPDPFERRNFVVPRTLAGLQRVSRVGAQARQEDVEPFAMIGRRLESVHWYQLVVRVKRRCVATGTTFAFEDPLSFRGLGTELIRILWRCERIQIQRQRV
jgi:hypothetical protein